MIYYYCFNIHFYGYPATSGNADPEIFIQGMQGYQWTDTDLDFVYQTKLKKQVQQAQVNECIFSKWNISVLHSIHLTLDTISEQYMLCNAKPFQL